MTDPWKLSPKQQEVLSAMADGGCMKLAARSLGMKVTTVHTHLDRAKEKMGARVLLQAVVQWDRFNREQG